MRRTFEPLEPLSSIFWSFCIRYVKIYIKFPFILYTLFSCSLIGIEVTRENVKIYFFNLFQICIKKITFWIKSI